MRSKQILLIEAEFQLVHGVDGRYLPGLQVVLFHMDFYCSTWLIYGALKAKESGHGSSI